MRYLFRFTQSSRKDCKGAVALLGSDIEVDDETVDRFKLVLDIDLCLVDGDEEFEGGELLMPSPASPGARLPSSGTGVGVSFSASMST